MPKENVSSKTVRRTKATASSVPTSSFHTSAMCLRRAYCFALDYSSHSMAFRHGPPVFRCSMVVNLSVALLVGGKVNLFITAAFCPYKSKPLFDGSGA
jgi:hypothetical protein